MGSEVKMTRYPRDREVKIKVPRSREVKMIKCPMGREVKNDKVPKR